MENIDITGKVKNLIRFGLIIPVAISAAIGYAAFEHRHHVEEIQINNAKVTGTLISVRSLVDGKINEILFDDGDKVESGDVIARLEVDVTPEAIAQLENTVALAKQNLEDLKLGQVVKVPVKRVRVIPSAPTRIDYPGTSGGVSSSELASLEQRANRMEELFEMGAISRNQRDAAVAAYENAKASSYSTPGYSTYVENEPTYVEEIEYVDQWQPTPPEALQNAENAIKQAELSLNVALQEAQETEVISPVSGTIYYSAIVEEEFNAGNALAKIGDSNELWLEAEVTEEIFNKVSMGVPVDYNLDGYNLAGTVIEKIAPDQKLEIDSMWFPPTADNPHPEFEIFGTDELPQEELHNDKYILKFSIPADFEGKPNSTADVKIKIF